jgi:hypothetical protein
MSINNSDNSDNNDIPAPAPENPDNNDIPAPTDNSADIIPDIVPAPTDDGAAALALALERDKTATALAFWKHVRDGNGWAPYIRDAAQVHVLNRCIQEKGPRQTPEEVLRWINEHRRKVPGGYHRSPEEEALSKQGKKDGNASERISWANAQQALRDMKPPTPKNPPMSPDLPAGQRLAIENERLAAEDAAKRAASKGVATFAGWPTKEEISKMNAVAKLELAERLRVMGKK